MLKKTLIASALTLGLISATSGVQANPLTNAFSGLINGVGFTDIQFDARRGGGARRSSVRRSSSSSRSSSKAVTTTNNKSSSTNNSSTNKTNQQQDAQFSQQARTGNTNTANTPATTTNAPAAAPAAAASGPGLGGTFVSSLAGAGAGVILGNMLMSPSAAASEGTQVATPDMLSNTQIDECLTQLDKDIKDVEAKLLDTPEEEQAKLREQLSQMNDLKITLKKEQLNRLQQEIQNSSSNS